MEDVCRMCRYAYDGRERVPLTLPCGHRICWQCSGQLRAEGALRCVQCEEISQAQARPLAVQQKPFPVPQGKNPFVLPPVPFPVQSLPNPELKAPVAEVKAPVAEQKAPVAALPLQLPRASEAIVIFVTPEGGCATLSFKLEDYMWVLIPAALDFIRDKTRKFELISPSGQPYTNTYLANTQLNAVMSAVSPLSIRIDYPQESISIQFTIKMPPGEVNLVSSFQPADSMVAVLEFVARNLRRQNYPFSFMRENGVVEDQIRLFGMTVRQFDSRNSVVLQVAYESSR